MKKRPTVTVGIPAYNEEANIKQLLHSILLQEQKNHVLKKIIVASDGSNDRTVELVRQLQQKYRFIALIDGKQRVGKAQRLNELYRKAATDILIMLDADIKLGHERVFDSIAAQFFHNRVGLVSGFDVPLLPTNFSQRIVHSWVNAWNEVRRNFIPSNSIHNHQGRISAMRRSLYKNLILPQNIHSDDDYLYFTGLQKGFRFLVAKDALVHYKVPSSLGDFSRQMSRYLLAKEAIVHHFGDWVHDHYHVDSSKKAHGLFRMFRKDPVSTLLAICLQLYIRLFKTFYSENRRSGAWTPVKSSKNLTHKS